MEKIIIFDYNTEGHHWVYDTSIIKKIKNKSILFCCPKLSIKQNNLLREYGIKTFNISNISNNKYIRVFNIIINFNKIITISNKFKCNVIHFFTLDYILIPLYFMFRFSKKKLSGTIHWVPKQNFKYFILKKLIIKNNLKIIVHGEYIKTEIEKKLGFSTDNILVGQYPIINNGELNKFNYSKLNRNKTILYFGGTRYDKGIDILLDSLQLVKNKANLIIAGKAEYFTKEFIDGELAQVKHINSCIDLKYISDQEMDKYYKISDIIVIPYRKIFGGQSGILTEAINYNKLIIAPEVGQLADTIKTNNLGLIYECENIEQLAKNIDLAIDNYDELLNKFIINQENYKKLATFEELAKKYNSLFY